MKLLKTITTCFFLSFLLFSCGSDDMMMEEEEEKMGLNGDWALQSVDVDVESVTSFQGSEISTNSVGEGKNLDYSLNLDDGNFTTEGAYDFEFSTTSSAIPAPILDTQNYSNVNGSGTYTNTETEITVDGQFFDFEFNGMPFTQSTGPATANYTIVDDVLTISQDEEMTTVTVVGTVTSKFTSISVWNRK